MTIRIKDNFLDPESFKNLQEVVFSTSFPWYMREGVSGMGDYSYNMMFSHVFYGDNMPTQYYLGLIVPILNNFDCDIKSLIRVKGNLYPKTDVLHEHNDHVDLDFPNNGAILYLNTNNGFTVIGGEKVESIANRMIYFDPEVPHHSTTCTDKLVRANINFNFF